MAFEGEHKIIPIKGIQRAVADSIVEDGAMNEIIGLEYKDGSFVPYMPDGDSVSRVPSGTVEIYVHNTSYGNNIIINDGSSLQWKTEANFDNNRGDWVRLTDFAGTPAFIANTLSVSSDIDIKHLVFDGVSYLKMSGDVTSYTPSLLRFRVSRGVAGYDEVDGNKPIASEFYETNLYSALSGNGSDIKDRWSEYLAVVKNMSVGGGLLSKAQGLLKEKGGLHGYFFVNFAYRLKSGDIKYASLPILLSPPNAKQGVNITQPTNDNATAEYERYYYPDYTGSISSELTKYADASEIQYTYPNLAVVDWASATTEEFYEGLSSDKEKTLLVSQYYQEGQDTFEGVCGGTTGTSARRHFHSLLYDKYNSIISVNPIPLTSFISLSFKNGNFGDEVSKIDKAYKKIYGYALSNKLQFSLDVNLARQLPSDVASICIFISDQVEPYIWDDDKYITRHGPFLSGEMLNGKGTVSSDFSLMYSYTPKKRSNQLIIEDLQRIKSMYLVKEIYLEELNDLTTDWVDVDLRGLLGDTLLTRESLPLTAFNHNDYVSEVMSAYNYRLHIANVKSKLFDGYAWKSLVNYYDNGRGQVYGTLSRFLDSPEFTTATEGITLTSIAYVTYIKNNDGSISTVVNRQEGINLIINGLQSILTYPNPNAYKIDVYINDTYKIEYDLYRNRYLGIAYSIAPDLQIDDNISSWGAGSFSDIPEATNTQLVDKNMLKVSDTGVPSVLPEKFTSTIGNGQIIGFARLSTALSQDTYGTNPLLVFCTDGIYSMEVDKSGAGAYSQVNLFSNEICTNANSICEIQGAVVFASQKGLMIASSAGVAEFIPYLNGSVKNTPEESESVKGLGLKYYNQVATYNNTISKINKTDFRDYVRNGNTRIAYISEKGALLVYNKYNDYSYLIEIDTRIATKLPISFKFHDNNFASHNFLQDDLYIYKFNYAPNYRIMPILMQTRPLKLSAHMKSAIRVVVRGRFNGNTGKYLSLLVLGSYDAEIWQPIGVMEKSVSSGAVHDMGVVTDKVTHKYMMIILSGELDTASHIDGIELTIDNKYNNKLR